jgi:hypothetical protein
VGATRPLEGDGWGCDNNCCCWSCDDELHRPAVVWQVSDTLLYQQSRERGTVWYQCSYSASLQNSLTCSNLWNMFLWNTAYLRFSWNYIWKWEGSEHPVPSLAYCAGMPMERGNINCFSYPNANLTTFLFVVFLLVRYLQRNISAYNLFVT